MNATRKERILVLCTGNSCRSQMAEGFFRHYGRGRIEAASAGLSPSVVNPVAIRVMNEVGIDIGGQTSDPVEKYIGQDWDYVITVCSNAEERCPIFPGKVKRLHWPFDDPAHVSGAEAEVLGVFRRVRDEIGTMIKNWLERDGVR